MKGRPGPARGTGPALALALALVSVAPTAAAAEPATGTARVELAWADGLWNGASSLNASAEGAGEVEYDLWVPATGEIVEVRLGEAAASWTYRSRDAIRVTGAPGQTATVRFALADRQPTLARYVAPAPVDGLAVMVAPPEGRVFDAEDAHGALVTGPLAAGDAVVIRVVDEGRVGELPLLATIGVLALAVLLLAKLWHVARPPLGGRPPEKFLDHLSELQARIVPAVVAFALLNVLYFVAGLRTMAVAGWTVPAPSWGVGGSIASRSFDAIAERLVPPDVPLVALRPADAVVAQVGISLFLAFATVLPLLVYELWGFIAPALMDRERRVTLAVTPLVTGLFVLGALLGYLVMAPLMLRTLYSYAPQLGAAPLLGVSDLIAFALLVVIAFALAFELPVVMYALARLGLVEARTFWRYLRHAIVAIVLLAGVITPDPSVVSQVLVAGPIVGLYLLGIGAAHLARKGRTAKA